MTTDPSDSSRLTRLLGFLAQDPDNLALLNDALTLAIATGDGLNGQRLIEHLQAHPCVDPQVCAQAAHVLLLLGDYAAAGEYGDRAIAGGVSHPAVLFNTAFGHFYNGDYPRAAALFTPLSAEPDCPAATLVMLARALHHQELTEEAEALAKRACQQEPGNSDYRGLLALLHYENDDNPAALRVAHETLADDPNQLEALLACGAAHFEQGSLDASRKTWLHTVDAYPTCGRAWSGLAQLEFNELEFDAAEAHLKLAVQYMPDHIGTWHLLAWIYILRNDSARARDALDRSYALDRTFGETHGGLAVVDVLDGREAEARVGIKRALKLSPDGLAAQYAEMLLLQKAGKTAEATQLLNERLDRTGPTGQDSGRALMEHWLRQHQGKRPQSPPGQH